MPKGKLLALLAIFAAVGVVTATGAFTTVEADRTAEVTTTDDANALLAIEPAKTPGAGTTTLTSNADTYVSSNSGGNGVVSIDFSGGASGINQNALTEFDRLLNVTNQGPQTVALDASVSNDDGSITASDHVTVNAVAADGTSTDITSGSVEIGTGDSVYIEVHVDLVGDSVGDDASILDTLELDANAV